MNKNIFIIDNSDERCKYLKTLFNDNETLDYLENSPITLSFVDVNYVFAPNKKLTVSEVLNFSDNSTVFCGKISNEVKDVFNKKMIVHKNFLSDELFAIQNAKLTAQSSLPIILEVTKRSINESKILIFGLGRVAKALAILLSKLDCSVTLCTFSQKEFECFPLYANNCFYEREYARRLNEFDLLINTIPSKFLLSSELNEIKNGANLIELASTPCIENSQINSFSYTVASGLPTKFTPISAGKLMYDFITGEKNGETKT